MRNYLEDSTSPMAKIAGVPLPRLILGNLPFIGESYQGPEKNRLYSERFSRIENTIRILKRAVSDYGLTVIGVMPPTMGELSRLFFEALRKISTETQVEIGLISCFMIPLTIRGERLDDYRKWVTYHSIEAKNSEVTEKYLRDPILLCREGWERRFPEVLAQMKPYSREEIADMTLDRARLDKMLATLSGFKTLLVEPGSETDFLALTGRTDILEKVVAVSTERFSCPVVVGTHHAGSTIPILDEYRIPISGYVTPVNLIGALMLPSQQHAMDAIANTKKAIIAIKPMAGGRIPPKKAFEYVFKKVGTTSCMIGVASETELQQDIQAANHCLKTKTAH